MKNKMKVKIGIYILMAVLLLGLMLSGGRMSRHLSSFLSISGGAAIARTLHHVSAYWFSVLISMHLGLHWSMIMGIMRRVLGRGKASKTRTVVLRVIALLIAAVGIHAFSKHQIGGYMLNRIEFASFDYDQTLVLFFLEYIAVMGLFTALGHYFGLL